MIDYYIQQKYLNLFSSEMPRFKQVKGDLWKCRCPFCGDSKKKESKTRGYFFVHDGCILFKCHNCGTSTSLISVIKELNPMLYRDLVLETFGKKQVSDEPRITVSKDMKQFQKRISDVLFEFNTIQPESVYWEYLTNRHIPQDKLNKFIEIPSMRGFAQKLERYKDTYFPDVKCIGIPFYVNGEVTFLQCRNIENDSLRYMTFEVNKGLKLFGFDDIDHSKRVSVLEGPFDSVFVYNAVANAGATDHSNIQSLVDSGARLRFIFDKDYETNAQVKKQLMEKIAQGHDVVIYDKYFTGKDINDIINKGMDIESLNSYLDSRTFNGMRAKLELSKLSR